MPTYTVSPLPDGTAMRGNWQVLENGRQRSTHTQKSAAKRAARRYASDGDELVIRRVDGTIQDRLTVRDASAGDDSADAARSLFKDFTFGSDHAERDDRDGFL